MRVDAVRVGLVSVVVACLAVIASFCFNRAQATEYNTYYFADKHIQCISIFSKEHGIYRCDRVDY